MNVGLKKILGIYAFLSFLGFLTHAAEPPAPNRVILLMLDGVRWQDVFRTPGETPLFKRMLSPQIAHRGMLVGDRNRGTEMSISNTSRFSLPGYESVLSGTFISDCESNHCGRISVETLPEALVRDVRFAPRDVAVFSSWQTIGVAAYSHGSAPGFVLNVGLSPLPGAEDLNRAQAQDLPIWGKARKDRYTFEQAFRYLRENSPRFLFVSLNDSDEWAHRGDRAQYVATLKQYDQWIEQFFNYVTSEAPDTLFIVTTDHGRGDGVGWKHHSAYPEARWVWMYASSPITRARSMTFGHSGYQHQDLRASMEAALGVHDRASIPELF